VETAAPRSSRAQAFDRTVEAGKAISLGKCRGAPSYVTTDSSDFSLARALGTVLASGRLGRDKRESLHDAGKSGRMAPAGRRDEASAVLPPARPCSAHAWPASRTPIADLHSTARLALVAADSCPWVQWWILQVHSRISGGARPSDREHDHLPARELTTGDVLESRGLAGARGVSSAQLLLPSAQRPRLQKVVES
jgi:hypothetical protein